MKDITPPVVNARGFEEHPAFAMLSASRVSASHGVTLFDSDIQHRQTIRIRLHTAARGRNLNRDWIQGEDQLFEVELSEAQWASFVSSMNTSGVPATLRWRAGAGDSPDLPYAPRLGESMAEVRSATTKALANIKAARDAYEEAISQKLGAAIIRERRKTLHYAIENAEGSMVFAADSLSEHFEGVVQKARADIEAMVANKAVALGLTAGQAAGLAELPMLEAEAPTCGSWGGCTLPVGHNMGRADIPENHRGRRRHT